MILVKSLAVFIVNFILYLAFGSIFTVRRDRKWSVAVTLAVGFFAYYGLFALVCFPIMFTYRPLSLLAYVWLVPCVVIVGISAILFGKKWAEKLCDIRGDIAKNRLLFAFVLAITVISVILTSITYNFTLDAAYYVANVTTNVDTNMINVYDAFTGSWQDHFELRYAFATYYTVDSVVCFLTGLPALIETKIVMSSVVMVIVNILYVHICRYFFDDTKRAVIMYAFMTAINYMFISMYTASNFLMTRTYEGKSIVANVSVIAIFTLYMILVKDADTKGLFVLLFIVCLGTATVSSTANMVIPAEVCILFIPYAVLHKKWGMIAKTILCIMPELVMMLIYVLYVKGYYAIYTFPR